MVVSHILEDLYNLARSSGPPVVGIWDRSTTSKFEVCNNVVHTHTHTLQHDDETTHIIAIIIDPCPIFRNHNA